METIGDCYMAVCGLPEPTHEHAERMADFALSMQVAMGVVCRNMGVDLSLRVGMHSGNCVAGVLMGDRARFQLFGDTVNMASRMESTGVPGRVQASDATARALRDSGMFHIEHRGKIVLKGKGAVDTFWLLERITGKAWQAPTGRPGGATRTPSFLGSVFGSRRSTSMASSDDAANSEHLGHLAPLDRRRSSSISNSVGAAADWAQVHEEEHAV